MSPDALAATLGDEDFVLLTTFRRNGEGVPTPVWISRVADQARIGPVEATAEMVHSGRDFDEVQGAIRAKYGWQCTLFALVGGFAIRRKGLTYRDTVVLITPTHQSSPREDTA